MKGKNNKNPIITGEFLGVVLASWTVALETASSAIAEVWGGQRDSNSQQPEPQSGALPLSYGHHLHVERSFYSPNRQVRLAASVP